MRDADRSDRAIAAPGSPVLRRRRHYGEFFGLDPLPERFGIVIGNCQAESMRLVLDAPERRFVRVPPVHELDAADAARLRELVALADHIVSQPIRDDYRSLPVGTRQITALAAGPS